MKELSIEEKAKRYDEAINRAKSKIKNDKDHVLYEEDITEIFPELKESEDERIRKAIICGMHALKDQKKTCFASIPIDDVIAWLEKQGERSIRIRSKHAQGKLKELIEKQSHENMVEALRTEYEKGRADAIAELKPIFDYSNADIKQKDYAEKQNTNDGFHPLIVEEIDLWIKENENVHHNDKNIIGVMRDMAYQVSALTKNLYNQKQWKPSDEQMKALQTAGNSFRPYEENHKVLFSLYEQLKAL